MQRNETKNKHTHEAGGYENTEECTYSTTEVKRKDKKKLSLDGRTGLRPTDRRDDAGICVYIPFILHPITLRNRIFFEFRGTYVHRCRIVLYDNYGM